MLSGPPSAKSAGCCDSGFSSNSYAYERHVPQRLPSPSLETVIPKKNRGISLTNIVQEQKSDGSWDLTQNFVEILGDKYNLETIKQAIYEYLKDISLPENLVCKLWATAIALALLETKFEQEQEKWNLLSTKSYNWMDEELKKQKTKTTVDDWVGAAKKWFDNQLIL